MIDLRTPYVKLNEAEAKTLHSLLRAKHGNVKACSEITGISVGTLKRAKDQLEITEDSAKIIREKLLSNQLQAA